MTGFADAPFRILRKRPHLLLCEGRKDRKHQLPIAGKGMDIFLFKPYLHADFLQISDCGEQVYRVPRKPRYALGQDNVDLPRLAVRNEAVEFLTLCRPGAADPEICVHPGKFPLRVRLYQVVVVAHLCGKGMGKAVRLHGNTGVSRHLLPLFQSRDFRLYPVYFSHFITSFQAVSFCLYHISL